MMDASSDKLLEKAADCFDLAETQHHAAEMQHEIASRQHCGADQLEVNAGKLEALGHVLEASAVEIKGNTAVVARGAPIPVSPTAPHPLVSPVVKSAA